MKKAILGGVVLLARHEGALYTLLVQHANQKHWGLPKGSVENGEDILDAARRELKEETGVTDFQLLSETPYNDHYITHNQQPPVEKTVTFYVAKGNFGPVSVPDDMIHEIMDVRWVLYEEALELIFHPSSKNVLESAVRDHEIHL